MDLSSMLNDGDAPPKKPSQGSPTAPVRPSAPQASPPAQNGTYSAGPGGYAPGRHSSQQQTPLFGPPSASVGPPSQVQSRGLTPLHTPSHAPGPGQYPFPQQPPSQSPATAHPGAQQYRGYEPYSATTPGARPPSHGFAQPSPSLGQYHNVLNAHPHSSLSPTPPSHPSQTPHSVRQSPLATMGHPPPPQQAPSHYYHQSQPNTPLGPPPQIPQRHSNNQLDMSSPYHQRTFSGASSGMVSGSPAQHHPSIGNLVDSPSVYQRPSPSRRRTSDYRSSMDRERSVSVSPKTIVQPRPPSLGSRHSSQQDVYSARSSLPPSANVAPSAETPGHVKPPTPTYAPAHHSYAASDVAQGYSQTAGSLPGPPVNGRPLSQSDNKTPLQHQPQKMGMNHLLAPTQHEQHATPQQYQQPPIQNGAPSYSMPPKQNGAEQAQSQSQAPPPASAASAAPPTQQHEQMKAEPPLKSEPSTSISSLPESASQTTSAPEVQPPPVKPTTDGVSASGPSQAKAPLKRPAESEPAAEPPAKRGRVRKYKERPVWAHLSHQNPRSRQPGIVPNGTGMSQPPPRTGNTNGAPALQPNGNGNTAQMNGASEDVPPWQQNPPLDDDLIWARKMLGPWEKSLVWKTPALALNREVQDWLYGQLEQHADIGTDPREGAIEIEAKIGTLIDNDTGRRCELPVRNTCVLSTSANRKYHFESAMNNIEHEKMNKFLNSAVQESHANKGRQPIKYTHIYQTDSFRNLSQAGVAALGPAAHRRRLDRDLKLRTSTNSKTGQVTARIVKIKLGEDLHIFGARDPYDVRISMNMEVDLNRPGLDPSTLIEENPERPPPVDRKKDRLSYQHLAYSVDLTRVDTQGMPPKFELELEVDAGALRKQIENIKTGQDNAYTNVVDGFMDNMMWLMKQQRQQ